MATQLEATRSRRTKVELIAEVMASVNPADAPAVMGLMVGRLRQGSIGVGYRTVRAALDELSPAAEATLTVTEVDSALTEFAELSGAGSAAAKARTLRALLSRATAAEQRFLASALTGEMRTGALDSLLIDGLAKGTNLPAARVRRAVMLSGSLGDVARLALSQPEQVAGVGLAVLTPIQPMLATTATDVSAALAITGEASVEHKLDGARLQLHRNGDEVRAFTRSLADVTARVPEIVQSVRELPVTSVILDGESLMLDDDGGPRPFQETMSRFGAHGAREQLLAPRLFDLLHLDGVDYLDLPLSERLDALRAIAPDLMIAGTITSDPVAAAQVLDDALAAGHEGVMVKALDSTYAAGRRGKHWVKVKPVYTYDLVVIGVERGSGRRSNWLSNLHLGAYDPVGEFGEPGGYVMVGKTFKGLTDALLKWQTETFPAYLKAPSESDWQFALRPEIVVEIAIDGVQRSTRYPGGVALRFARVKRYRVGADAKPATEADTIQTLRTLLPATD